MGTTSTPRTIQPDDMPTTPDETTGAQPGSEIGTRPRPRYGGRADWSLWELGKFNGPRGYTPQRSEGRKISRPIVPGPRVATWPGQRVAPADRGAYLITASPCARRRSGSHRHWSGRRRCLS